MTLSAQMGEVSPWMHSAERAAMATADATDLEQPPVALKQFRVKVVGLELELHSYMFSLCLGRHENVISCTPLPGRES